MKIWKKNLVAAALLVTVCIGIYANWSYTQDQQTMDLTDTLNEEKLLSEDLMVMAEENEEDIQTTASNYFAAIRLSRQEARDNALSMLQEAMAYNDTEDTSTAGETLEGIVESALCEAQIESLVVAKGYMDCVAYIGEEGISIAVAAPEGGLQQSDVALIADIVMSQSDFTLDKIRVVEVM